MLALRSRLPKRLFLAVVLRHYGRFLESECDRLTAAETMIQSINRADASFAQRGSELGELPDWWDGVTRWKLRTMISVFEDNVRNDAELLRIIRTRRSRLEARPVASLG